MPCFRLQEAISLRVNPQLPAAINEHCAQVVDFSFQHRERARGNRRGSTKRRHEEVPRRKLPTRTKVAQSQTWTKESGVLNVACIEFISLFFEHPKEFRKSPRISRRFQVVFGSFQPAWVVLE
jgi:hypothetical protein